MGAPSKQLTAAEKETEPRSLRPKVKKGGKSAIEIAIEELIASHRSEFDALISKHTGGS